MSELAELPKHTYLIIYLIQSYVQVLVQVAATTGQVAAPASPVVVVIVVIPNPMPTSWDARSRRPLGFGVVNVPPGYARGHGPRRFGQLNVLLGYARGHGPQRFGHVNVGGSVGSMGPPIKFSQR